MSDLISRKAVEKIIKEILISQQKELATDSNVVTKSGKDNNAIEVMNKMKEAKKWEKQRVIKY